MLPPTRIWGVLSRLTTTSSNRDWPKTNLGLSAALSVLGKHTLSGSLAVPGARHKMMCWQSAPSFMAATFILRAASISNCLFCNSSSVIPKHKISTNILSPLLSLLNISGGWPALFTRFIALKALAKRCEPAGIAHIVTANRKIKTEHSTSPNNAKGCKSLSSRFSGGKAHLIINRAAAAQYRAATTLYLGWWKILAKPFFKHSQ